MNAFERFRSRPRLSGRPTSANGASSFHLWWQLPSTAPIVAAAVTLRIERAPAVSALHFWALQVGFADRGRRLGGAHTGLQWHPGSPGGAVNWGGYDVAGVELPGTESPLPPVDSANTRAWPWRPGDDFRIRVWSPQPGRWRSAVTELRTGRVAEIRDLLVDADELTEPVVWAEVFARCDDPPSVVRWSDFAVVDAAGAVTRPTALRVTYQPRAEGGCDNTVADVDGGVARQRTGQPHGRSGRSGDVLPLTPTVDDG